MQHQKKCGIRNQAGLRLADGPAFFFKRRSAAPAVCLLFALAWVSCGTLRVQQMQRHADQGDDAWIVAQPVDCDTPAQACAQLHLIKGKSCLRLAELGQAPAPHYACASDELAAGIALKPAWADMAEQLELHERYCDALDGLQQVQTEPAADETRNRLLEAAQALYQLAPDSIPAVYYISVAGLRQLEPRISTVNAANRLPVCNRLKRKLNQVLPLIEAAKHEHFPDWNRFAKRYQRLAFDLGAAILAAECR